MKFAANIARLWSELPVSDRFQAAADAGFQGVAVPDPYDVAASETHRAALRAGVKIVHISAPPPNYTGGLRGFAGMPECRERFRYDLRRALRYSEALGAPILHILAGTGSGVEARACLVDNLIHAAFQTQDGPVMTLQPISGRDLLLNDFGWTADVLREVGAANVGLQFHRRHARLLHGDAIATLRAHADLVRHIQIADEDTDGAPKSDLSAFLEAAGTCCPQCWIVADYDPGPNTDRTLDWFAEFRD